jgi:two-component system cell cycle sensor histidine kinase/response regulator CckA
MLNVPRSSSLRYIVIFLSVGLALIVTLQLDLLARRTPFTLFYAAVLVSALYGGRNSGLLATLLSALVSDYFIIPPLYSFRPDSINFLEESMFISVALLIIWLTSARQHSETSRRESEERYRLLFESNPLPMWVYDLETLAFLAINEAAIHHYGYSREEFLAMTIKDIRPVEDVAALLDAVPKTDLGLSPVPRTWRHLKKDGIVIDVEITSHTLVFGGRRAELVLANDITDRKQLEEQLRQSQKLESIGQLAGGVAHDFNNLLTVITGYTDICLSRLADNDPLRRNLEQIKRAAERASSLTRQLLAFSRKQILQPKIVDLTMTVTNLDKMLQRLIGEDVELVTILDPKLGNIKADPGQIEQVLMNLAVNARDAMSTGGKLTIETKNVYLDEAYARRHVGATAGPHVMLAVSDTGHGMDAETQARIFEPFFTTKEQGKGTGLGLAMVYGIVRQSGGNIWVYSEPKHGTTFKVYLPMVEEKGEVRDEGANVRKPERGTETILLVEDEDAVRLLLLDILESEGYTVLAASNGQEALDTCGKYAGSIHLLMTDVVMPGMSGRQLVERMSEKCGNAKVLYMSGYTDNAIVHHGVLDPGLAFLQKPFTPIAAAHKVREVLDSADKER